MRVLIVPSWYPQDDKPNSGIFFKEQAIALQEAGIEVIVAYPEIHSMTELKQRSFRRGFYHEFEDGIETYRLKEYNFLPKVPRGTSIIYYFNLKKILNSIIRNGKKPDIIHAHSILWGGWAASKISKEYNIPLIITEHSSAFGRNLIKNYQKPMIREGFSQAKKIIVVSSSLKVQLENYTEEDKFEVIPNIVDISKFKIQTNTSTHKKSKFRFFSLAFLTYNKGFDILINAFSQAFKGNDQVELVIGGDGVERHNLENLVKTLGLENQISFLGELDRDQVVIEMQKCDAFVLASRYETFGVVYIEALACGKPIIATKCGGPEMIVNEKNGLLVKVDNINELGKALVKIKQNIFCYSKDEIILDCNQRFSKERVVLQIIKQYQTVT